MSENTVIIKGRIRHKHDTEENWNKATNFAPLLGETIVYDPDTTHSYPRYKTGIWDGESTKTAEMLIMNLPFANQPDIITEDDLLGLFTSNNTRRTIVESTSFNIHLIDTSDNTLTVASIQYMPGITTWGDLIADYPGYFTATTTEWDKNTGKPYVRFTAPYHGNDYVIKKVTPVRIEDPVSVPCIVTDLVDPTILRVTYVCHDPANCAICASYR